MIFSELIFNSVWQNPLLATTNEAENAPIVLAGVLLSLIVIYLASKIGGELSKMIDLPPVLGELLGGVVVGASALKLVVFPDSGAAASDSIIMTILQFINNISPEAVT